MKIDLIKTLIKTRHPALERLADTIKENDGDGDEDKENKKPKRPGYSRMHHRHNRSN